MRKLLFVAVVLAFCFAHGSVAFASRLYRLVDLGDLPGGANQSQAYGLNDAGQIAGVSAVDGDSHAFIWQAGAMTDLGTLGGPHSYALGINASGQVVGQSTASAGGPNHAFLWDAGIMRDLGTLGGAWSTAYGINAGGQVIGFSETPTIAGGAFRWQNGVMEDLGTLGGKEGAARGINDLGQVVGWSLDERGATVPAVWTGGIPASLELGGKDAGLGLSINNAGHVVGYTTDSLGAHATSWVNGAMTDLGTLGGPGSTAYFISPRGLILGMSTISSDTSFGHAVLWDEQRQRLDLNTLLDKSGSGWTLLDARAMNASGQIIGNGRTPNGAQHGYLLIPTVEPTAHVVGVKVSGFAWSDETYSMPVGSADQLRPLPWIGADQVTLTFDQQVVLQRDDMVVIDGAGSRRRLFGPVVSNDAAGTSSATWQIDGPLPRGATTLLLFDRVTDVFGNALDGEWADGVSVRSGDGLPGGPFAFHLNLLPGDANQDGSVNLIDAIGVRDRMGSVPALDGSFYDFDRNGVINRGDIAILARNLFAQVPPAAGAVPVPEPSTTTLALVGAAFIGLAAFTRRRSGAAVRESR